MILHKIDVVFMDLSVGAFKASFFVPQCETKPVNLASMDGYEICLMGEWNSLPKDPTKRLKLWSPGPAMALHTPGLPDLILPKRHRPMRKDDSAFGANDAV